MSEHTTDTEEVGFAYRLETANTSMGFSENSDNAVKVFPNPRDFFAAVSKRIESQPAR